MCDRMSCLCFFFFSSRRRHTRCALVTGVQTCALPISLDALAPAGTAITGAALAAVQSTLASILDLSLLGVDISLARSEERRVGKECVSTCRSRWSPYH